MPYGYYTLLRLVLSLFSGFYVYKYYLKENYVVSFISGFILLFFQPICPVYLSREIWNVIDILVAIFIIALMVYEYFDDKREQKG